MLIYEQIVGKWKDSPDLTPERIANIKDKLIPAITDLYIHMVNLDIPFPINPVTKSQISGQTFGGFRPQSCPQGAAKSSHKEGLAVDIYDPENKIDNWLLKNPEVLVKYNIFIEHPDKTPRWSHWSVRKPLSGNHIFYP